MKFVIFLLITYLDIETLYVYYTELLIYLIEALSLFDDFFQDILCEFGGVLPLRHYLPRQHSSSQLQGLFINTLVAIIELPVVDD